LWILVAGSGVGQILSLVFHNFHFLVGLAAAGYVWTVLSGNQPYAHKYLQLFLIASALPIFILDVCNPFLKLLVMLAFSGAPFLFTIIHSGDKTGEKEDLAKLAFNERLIEFATAASAIFALSILPGNNSYLHRIFVAAIFAGAAFGTYQLFPIVISKVPPAKKEQIDPHQVPIFAALEIIIGNLILFILSFILPGSVLEAEHSIGAVLFYTLFGMIFLAGGNALSTNFLAKLVPAATYELIHKIALIAIIASYALLLFAATLPVSAPETAL